jgi:cobalt-zinc-cadmium efflux system outer membrane protein
MKELLGRPQDSPEIITEPLVARIIPFSAAELLQKARDQNPNLQAQNANIRRRETEVEIAHRNSRPDFNVQYNYQHTASEFRDYYMATFSVRLPNRGRQKAELAQAQEKEEQSRHELDSESQQVLSEVQQQYVKAKTTEEQLKIYSDGLIPQSKATFRAALSAYQSNRQDFASLLSVFLDVLNFDMEYRNQLAEHEAALADLERLTGVEFR